MERAAPSCLRPRGGNAKSVESYAFEGLCRPSFFGLECYARDKPNWRVRVHPWGHLRESALSPSPTDTGFESTR
jgi:hypothetical protein